MEAATSFAATSNAIDNRHSLISCLQRAPHGVVAVVLMMLHRGALNLCPATQSDIKACELTARPDSVKSERATNGVDNERNRSADLIQKDYKYS